MKISIAFEVYTLYYALLVFCLASTASINNTTAKNDEPKIKSTDLSSNTTVHKNVTFILNSNNTITNITTLNGAGKNVSTVLNDKLLTANKTAVNVTTLPSTPKPKKNPILVEKYKPVAPIESTTQEKPLVIVEHLKVKMPVTESNLSPETAALFAAASEEENERIQKTPVSSSRWKWYKEHYKQSCTYTFHKGGSIVKKCENNNIDLSPFAGRIEEVETTPDSEDRTIDEDIQQRLADMEYKRFDTILN